MEYQIQYLSGFYWLKSYNFQWFPKASILPPIFHHGVRTNDPRYGATNTTSHPIVWYNWGRHLVDKINYEQHFFLSEALRYVHNNGDKLPPTQGEMS